MDPVSQPILVLMDYRGGDRFRRCLASVAQSEQYFSRILISVTAAPDSEDMAIANQYRADHPGSKVEIFCTGVELPTLQHQAFWVDHLEKSGTSPADWIYWLAYDDQVRPAGIERISRPDGSWNLSPGTAYFGPWAMRHEQADELYPGPWDEPLESWTSFPVPEPTRLPVIEWIARQLKQPTYMQMSGSICSFESFLQLRDGRPRKTGPMRIEMAIASATCNTHVEEFPEPISIIYGRPNSDRASYGSAARKEDKHLLLWLARYGIAHPRSIPSLIGQSFSVGAQFLGLGMKAETTVEEDWVVRGTVQP